METNSNSNQRKKHASALDLESHLGYVLRQVSNHVSGQFAQALRAHQASVAEWVVMCHLQCGQQMNPSELADALVFTRGAISKVLVKLESKGWITRETDAADNRAQLIALTRSGRRIFPELVKIADRNDESHFSCLSESESVALRRILLKLTNFHSISSVPVD